MSHNIVKDHYDTKGGYGISKKRLTAIMALVREVSGKTILDIGCGNGFLGEQFKQQGAHEVAGVDISNQAIQKAVLVLDTAVECDLEHDDISKSLGGMTYDVVVATELIEHLFAPEVFLDQVKSLLKPEGVLVLTTPNLLVWTNRLRMLFGHFNYTDTGLMDRGHIHFFTYDSLHRLLVKMGYEVVAENNVYHRRIPIFIAKLFPNLFVFQTVVKCRVKNV